MLLKNCRCIEIDVHNGEYPKSADGSTSPHKQPHSRHGSGSAMSSRAAAAILTAEEKYENAKHMLAKTTIGKELMPQEEDLVVDTNGRPPSIRSLVLGEPLVLHGWTLTTPVGFRAVCQAIRESAFATSNLPIIVSLEVHADLEQQETMVTIMKEEWKGLLVDEAHETCNPEERLPRLDELLNKILIKVKKAASNNALSGASTEALTPTPSITSAGPSPMSASSALSPTASLTTLSPIPSKVDNESIHSSSEDDRGHTIKKKSRICENLSRLGIYTHSEHFTSFEVKAAKTPCHIFSVGESQILDLHQKEGAELFAHNRDFLMRAFPAGFRFDSSNLDPSVFWRRGVQMVALNWQKLDEGMMLSEGMFAGSKGWMLKPPGYRSVDPSVPPEAHEAIQYRTLDLKVTIFAGQHIPIPAHQTEKAFHPYIKCELHVERREERTGETVEAGGRAKEGEHKVRTAHKQGDHPDFGPAGETLKFSGIQGVVEELSFIRCVNSSPFSSPLSPLLSQYHFLNAYNLCMQ